LKDKVSVFGLGYVGLTIVCCLTSRGFKVIGYDVNEEKIKLIKEAKPPFYEPKLDKLLEKAVKEGGLTYTTNPTKAIMDSSVTFIAVGTPSNPDGSVNLSYIKSSAETIGEALKEKNEWHLVAIKSTVPPGTTMNIVKPIIEEKSGKECCEDFGLCMNSEFLSEGTAVENFINPDRIVIGESDKRSGDQLEKLYRKFYGEKCPPILRTNPVNAELIKYVSNAFLAAKISFINEIANICQKIPGADVNVVAKGMGLDKRIGPQFLRAGLGFGGYCLPKDLRALIHHYRKLGYEPKLLEAVEKVNLKQPLKAVELAEELIGNLKGRTIAILGLAFKPGTDDMREAVSITIINKLLEKGTKVKAYDPKAIPNAKKILGDKMEYADSPINCIKDAHCCIIVTEWLEFKKLKPEDFRKHMKMPAIIDGRRIFNPEKFKERVLYEAVGLG